MIEDADPCLPILAAAAILGLTGTASRACDFTGAAHSSVSAVCIGVGGGSLPAFLAHHYPGMRVEAVELDPVVVQAATSAMGFPDSRLLAFARVDQAQKHVDAQ